MKVDWINEINSRNSEEKFCIHSENAICIWRMLFVLRRCCSSRKRCTNCEFAVHQICFHHNHRWISNKRNLVPIFSVVAVFVHSSGSTVGTRFLLIFFFNSCLQVNAFVHLCNTFVLQKWHNLSCFIWLLTASEATYTALYCTVPGVAHTQLQLENKAQSVRVSCYFCCYVPPVSLYLVRNTTCLIICT